MNEAMTLPTAQSGPGATNLQALAEAGFAVSRRRVIVPVTDGGTAGTAALESVIFSAESYLTGSSSGSGAIALVGALFMPQVTLAVAATDFFTLNIAQRTSGGAATTVATITSNSGGTALTAFVPVAMTAGGGGFPAILVAGTDVLTMALTKTGAGKAIASATGAAYVQLIIDEL